MGAITQTIQTPDLWNYQPEFNKDGTEKHISLDGAYFHVLSYYLKNGKAYTECSCKNCEINRIN